MTGGLGRQAQARGSGASGRPARRWRAASAGRG